MQLASAKRRPPLLQPCKCITNPLVMFRCGVLAPAIPMWCLCAVFFVVHLAHYTFSWKWPLVIYTMLLAPVVLVEWAKGPT